MRHVDRVIKELQNLDMSAIDSIIRLIAEHSAGTIYVIGNGGSLATAQHLVNDLFKALRIKAVSLTDLPTFSAYANDRGFENVYIDQLELLFNSRDLLICISGSGKSPNILNAANYAKNICGGSVISLTGFNGGDLIQFSTRGIYLPSTDMRVIESTHSAICHELIDRLERTELCWY